MEMTRQQHDEQIFALVTGLRSDCSDPIEQAIADRFTTILPRLARRKGEYVYDGNRCRADQLGWRFLQMFGPFRAPQYRDIRDGVYDAQIEATWHEAASSEHWYMYEKDWGQ